jgi:hypothetical protein
MQTAAAQAGVTRCPKKDVAGMPPPAPPVPASTLANFHPNRAPGARARQFAGRACAGACPPGTALPLEYRKARKQLTAHLSTIQMEHDPQRRWTVPADLVPAVRAVSFEPARERICVACCILTGPTPVPRAILDASQPPHDCTATTPCGHRAGGAPARCLPEIGSAGGPAAVATTTLTAPAAASVAAPVGDSSRLPRPSICEILMYELHDPELWTDLPAELRKRVARLMWKLLCKLRDARDDNAKRAAFLDLFLMPVAVLRRLLPGEAGANSPARQAQSLVERLRLAHARIEMTPLWHAAQAATADCRRRRGTSKPAPGP